MAGSIQYGSEVTCAMGVKDRKASIDWYTGVLGFRLLHDMEDIGWCELASGIPGVNVGFSEVEDPKAEGGATVVLEVRDIDAARTELERQGVRFDGETQTYPGFVRLATFFDPDGHKLMFSQSLANAGQ